MKQLKKAEDILNKAEQLFEVEIAFISLTD